MFKRETDSERIRERERGVHAIAPVPYMLHFVAKLTLPWLPIIPDLKIEHVIMWR